MLLGGSYNHGMRELKPIAGSWKFCPVCGAARGSNAANPFRCLSCEYVHHFSPVSAVAAITADSVGNVLLLIRARNPGKGKFGLPGGFVDPGERAEDALHREVFEEVGLRVTQLDFLTSYPNSYAYGGVILPVTDLFFSAEVNSFEDMHARDGEIEGWRFCRPGENELNSMAFESNRRALEDYLKK